MIKITTIKTTVNQNELYQALNFLEHSVLYLEECSNKAGGGFAIEIGIKTVHKNVTAEISLTAKKAIMELLDILF